MIDQALNTAINQSYYFQFFPLNLFLKKLPAPSSDNTFKFSIYKGSQKFDENKIMSQSNFQKNGSIESMSFSKCQLNFYIPNYNKFRKIEFTLKLNMTEGGEEYEMASLVITPEAYIRAFKEEKANRFEESSPFSDEFQLEYQIYVQKSRFSLQKVVKQFKKERSMKSPLKEQTDQKQQASPSKKSESVGKNIDSESNGGRSKNSRQIQAPQLNRRQITNEASQIKMKRSDRLSTLVEIEQPKTAKPQSNTMYNVKIVVFMLISLVFIYIAMSPNRKYTTR